MKKSLFVILLILLITFTLCGCNCQIEKYAFGSYYSISLEGKSSQKIAKSLENIISDLDKTLATNDVNSDVYKINNAKANQKVSVSEITLSVFRLSYELYKDTNGAFNPASYPLTELWGFSPEKYTGIATSIPSETDIQTTLSYSDMDLFTWDESDSTITKLNDNAKLDFGAIAKGYAADICYEIAEKCDKLVLDIGRTFRVKNTIELYVANPREGDFVAKATINDKAVATSGDYERYYFYNDKRYHHIIDRQGYPAGTSEANPIISATIIGESATICDAFSTATMVLGYEGSKSILQKYGCSALLLTETGYYVIGENVFEILDGTRQKLN